MKKQLFSVLCFLMLCVGMRAQTDLANYTFSKSVGTYVPLSSPTVLGTASDNTGANSLDDVNYRLAFPAGFTFTYGGVAQSTLNINTNGFVGFSSAIWTTSGGYTPLSGTPTGGTTTGMISAFGRDLNSYFVTGTVGEISWELVGSVPNRELVIQYKNFRPYVTTATVGPLLNFQIRLFEATHATNPNQVVASYGNCVISSATVTDLQIGIRGNSTTTWASNINSLQIGDIPAGTTCNWMDAVTSNNNTSNLIFTSTNTLVAIPDGLTYSWAPPVTALAPVRAFSAVTAISHTSATVAWTAPTNATQYNVQYRIPGTCNWTNFSGNPVMTNSVNLTGLTQSTVYQVRVQSSNGSNNAIWSHIPNASGAGSGYSATGTFKTLDPYCTAPVAQPTALVWTPSTTSVTATFAASSPTVTNYLVVRTLGTAPNTPTDGVTYTAGASAALNGTVVSVGTTTTISNTGLVGNTNYTYYVYAYNSISGTCIPVYLGASPLTSSITTCPARATALTSSAVTANSFNLSWTASVGGTALPITYSVEVSSNAGFTAPVAGSPFLIAEPTTSLSITGLNPATTYYYRVTADNGCNIGATTSGNVTTSVIATDLQTVQLVGPAVNASGCYGSSIPVVVQIKNAGGSPLDFSTNNATVIASITGPNPQSYTATVATGTLAAGATQTVAVTTTYNMSAIGVYTINATSTLATPDANPSNDAMIAGTRTSGATVPIINPFTGFDGSNLATVFPLWSEGAGAVAPTGTTSNWLSQTGLNGTGNITAKINLYTTTRNEWIISPKFTVAPGVNMTFDAAVTEYNALGVDASNSMNGTDDKVDVMISTDCGATYTSLLSIGQSYSLTPAFRSFSVSLAAYAGQNVMIGFKATDGPIDDANDYDFHIDNVNINTCFPPTALTTTNTTINTVDLGWTAAAFGTPNYVYEVRTSGAAGSGATGLVTSGTVTSPSTSVTATGLSATTAYSVYVRSDCGSGDFSLWTPVKTFTTPAACPAATTPTVTSIAGYSAVASWTVGSTETMWDIYYGPSPLTAPTATTVPTATVGTTPSYTMSALTPTTGYAVYVRANCGAGNLSTWSAVRNFTTTVSCPAPSNLTISTLTPTSAVSTWTVGGAETSWLVRYSAPTTTATASGTPSYTLAGLTPNTTYSVQVKAICGAGDSSAYTAVRVLTTPCQPSDVIVTGSSRCGVGTTTLMATSTSTSATFQWYSASSGGAAIATGSVYTTPSISANTTYYVSSTDNVYLSHVGPLTNASTLSYYITTGWGITFNASANTTLNSVAVYPGSAGTVTLSVQSNATGTTVFGTYVATFSTSDIGQKTVLPLNINVPAGTGYKVLVTGYSAGFTGFHRESTSGFPYTTSGNPISVTSSEWGGTTTGTYYFFYDFTAQAGCESARSAVTATVTAPQPLTLTTATTVCGNVVGTVSVTSTLADYDSYVWSPLTNLYTDASATIPYTGGSASTLYYKSAVAGTTNYVVTAQNSVNGCGNTASTQMTAEVPAINATASPTMICSGTSVNLNATTNVIGAGTVAVGTATTLTGLTEQPTAFCNRWVSYRMQTVYTAAELSAAGLSAGNITSMSYSISSLGDAATNANFTVKCGTTTATTLAAYTATTGFAIVFPSATYTHSVGLNTIVFGTPFNWDGVSNLIVEVSHDGANGTNNSETFYSTTAANTVVWAYNGNAAAASSKRLNTRFGGQAVIQGAGSLTWQWNPGAVSSNTAVVNPVNTGTNAVVSTYTVTGVNPATTCSNSAVVSITVNPIPAAPTAFNSTQCGVGVPTASVTGLGGTYIWYTAPTGTTTLQSSTSATYTTAVATSTTFYVSETNGNCEGPRTAVSVTVTTPDAITASVNTSSICPNSAVTLSVTQTGSTNTYTYSWTGSPVTGSGIPTSVNGATASIVPTVAGLYTYTVTGNDGTCNAISTITLNVIAPPATPTISPATPSLCAGSSTTLTALGATSTVSLMTENFEGGTLGSFTVVNLTGDNGGTTTQWANRTSPYSGGLWGTINSGSSRFAAANADPGGSGTIVNSAMISAAFNTNGYSSLNLDFRHHYNYFAFAGPDICYVEVSTDGTTWTSVKTYTTDQGAAASFIGESIPLNSYVNQASLQFRFRFNSGWNYGWGIDDIALVGTQNLSSVTYSWSPATGLSATTGTAVVANPASTTVYTVTADNGSCTSSKVFTLTVNPVPTVSLTASTTSLCSGTSASLTATGATTYAWLPAGGTASLAVVSPTTTTVYTVTGTSAGCSTTQTVNLNVTASPTVVASVSPTVICAGATVSLTASGATTYNWMPNSSTSGTTTATPTVSTTYTVTGTTAGCTNTRTLSVTVNTIPTLTVTSNPSSGALCTTGATATLTAAGTSTSYAWSNSANTATTSVAPTVTTVYTVTGTNSCGVRTATTSIAVATTPTISASTSSSLSCASNSVVLTANATAGVTYSWNTGATTRSITVSPASTTNYTVTATNACGTSTATIVQNVSPCTSIEEAFTGSSISIYPNPASEYVNISIPATVASANTTVEVTDALGKLVMVETLNTDVTSLKITKLEEGVYFFKVISNNQTIKVGKVVKH